MQGGGHGPLTNLYGFAADNALAFDVVTADGRFLTANAVENKDLYYALKGGGPSTYAVILSVTMKTFPDNLPSAGLYLNINGTMTKDFGLILKALDKIHKMANYMVDNGLYAIYELYPPPILGALHVQPIMGLNLTAVQLDAIMKPLFDFLKAEGIPYDSGTKEYRTWYELYMDLFEPESAGQNGLTGGWTFSHQDMSGDLAELGSAINLSLSPRSDLVGIVISHLFNPGHKIATSQSATHPGWRNATMRLMSILPSPLDATWSQKQDLDNVMANTISKAFMKAGPTGLAYVNEVSSRCLPSVARRPAHCDQNYWNLPNWQEAFWGSVYPTLKSTKAAWDPLGVFYAVSTPGTEAWKVIDYGKRLCRKV